MLEAGVIWVVDAKREVKGDIQFSIDNWERDARGDANEGSEISWTLVQFSNRGIGKKDTDVAGCSGVRAHFKYIKNQNFTRNLDHCVHNQDPRRNICIELGIVEQAIRHHRDGYIHGLGIVGANLAGGNWNFPKKFVFVIHQSRTVFVLEAHLVWVGDGEIHVQGHIQIDAHLEGSKEKRRPSKVIESMVVEGSLALNTVKAKITTTRTKTTMTAAVTPRQMFLRLCLLLGLGRCHKLNLERVLIKSDSISSGLGKS
ncbi:hypothetical protein GH714_003868 [Hevea brasiliensis]|uniref:Uncharacterized protein n=1 Tax=Hevea brasiliensis TaxID=3981 RepID=A0A6A6KGH4_HEVBR|nr:hypothetical protein GH714_003868 [Hevea brasiliensis]